ncbi:hypothetical protein BJV82DRAFT_27907 [Fennellomyces sp. T-0311]|nr:hypothetical protein BJV82DRAFT_27907 [Fennellomyces sp. T-0311]
MRNNTISTRFHSLPMFLCEASSRIRLRFVQEYLRTTHHSQWNMYKLVSKAVQHFAIADVETDLQLLARTIERGFNSAATGRFKKMSRRAQKRAKRMQGRVGRIMNCAGIRKIFLEVYLAVSMMDPLLCPECLTVALSIQEWRKLYQLELDLAILKNKSDALRQRSP